jgi:hypothetical protein
MRKKSRFDAADEVNASDENLPESKRRNPFMPRHKTNPSLSNVSVVIPRRIHRMARVKALRSGAPSFPAWLAMVLEAAPESASGSAMVHMMCIELELKGLSQ